MAEVLSSHQVRWRCLQGSAKSFGWWWSIPLFFTIYVMGSPATLFHCFSCPLFPSISFVLAVPPLLHFLSHFTVSFKSGAVSFLSHQFSFHHLKMVLLTVLLGLMFHCYVGVMKLHQTTTAATEANPIHWPLAARDTTLICDSTVDFTLARSTHTRQCSYPPSVGWNL